MKNSTYVFKELKICSYGLTSVHNVVPQVTNGIVTAGSTWELVMNVTYTEIIDKLKQHFGLAGKPIAENTSSVQQFRNHQSTLNSYLASAGKTVDSRVGIELGSGFDSALQNYLSLIDVTKRTKRDRRNHLHLIRRLHVESLPTDRLRGRKSDRPVTSLSIELRTAISKTGLSPKTLAKRSGLSTSALQRWIAGALPNKRGIPTLRRLEAELNVPRETFVKLLKNDETVIAANLPAVPYREKLRARREAAGKDETGEKKSYVLPESALSEDFKEEWQRLFNYKAAVYTSLERQARGHWRCIPASTSVSLSPLAKRGGLVCPTAKMVIEKLRSFLGVIFQLPATLGGFSPSLSDTPQTIAWLANPEALTIYLERLTQCSEGTKHRGQKVFSATVASLVRPQTGYLWQQPSFRTKLPSPFRPETDDAWRRMCEESHKLLRAYIAQSKGTSRRPEEPIAHLLEEDDPLAPILKAIDAIEQAAAAALPGGIKEATLRRDALLLSMILANPLRLRAFISMTWNLNGTGTLRGSSRQGWRIVLERHHMKNGETESNKSYDVRVALWVKPRLDAYLEEYRGTLLRGKESPYLFVSSQNGGMMKCMGKHISEITRRYVADSPGFGAQAFRHLIATDWLTRHPNDYLTVAELLNDLLSTVIAHYAHLKRDTSFLRYEEHLESILGCNSK